MPLGKSIIKIIFNFAKLKFVLCHHTRSIEMDQNEKGVWFLVLLK
jgi:hypothetical protein